MPRRAFPILTVDDLSSATAFYATFGFTESYRFPPGDEPQFLTVGRGDDLLGLAAGPAEDRVAYWIDVEDVDGTVAELEAGGAEVVEAPADRPWGERVASLRDPAGHLVHLGSPAPER